MTTRTAPGRTVRRLALVAVTAATLGACGTSHVPGTTTSSTGRVARTEGSSSPTTQATAGSTSTPATGRPTTTTSPSHPTSGQVPHDFAISSVSFVSSEVGVALGSVACGMRTCAALARTGDGGRTWSNAPAPPISDPRGITPGAAEVRFSDAEDGWVFDWPETGLWATHDGGAHWLRPVWSVSGPLASDEVTDVEVADDEVRVALVGAGGVLVESSPVATESWTASSVLIPIGAGPIPFGQLALSGSAAWLTENDRGIVGAARLSDGSWTKWTSPDCEGTSGMAASSPLDLVMVCSQGLYVSTPAQALFSDDGGTTLTPSPTLPPSHGDLGPFGYGAAVGSPGADVIVAGTTTSSGSRLEATFDGGHSWQSVASNPLSASGTWSEVTFVSATLGFAVAEGQAGPGPVVAGSLLETTDGGHHWTAVSLGGGQPSAGGRTT